MTKYLFIDGGYLLKVADELGKQYFGAPIPLNFDSFTKGYEKRFFYDCLPDKNEDESTEEWEAKAKPRADLHDSLRVLHGFHVFEGVTVRVGRRRRQKGVDVMIAVHMLTHSFRKNMDQATLLAGDADFKPLLDALVQEGMFTTLRFEPTSASKALIRAADAQSLITPWQLWEHALPEFQQRFPRPLFALEFTSCIPDSGLIVRTTGCGVSFFQWKNQNDWHVAYHRTPPLPNHVVHIAGPAWETVAIRMRMDGLDAPTAPE